MRWPLTEIRAPCFSQKMKPSLWFRLVLLSGAWLLAGCSTIHSHGPGSFPGFNAVVRVGDTVEIRRHDGSQEKFVVSAVDATSVSGPATVIPQAEVAELKVHRFSPTKTYTLVGVLVVAGAAALAASDVGDVVNLAGAP
jgi:hypothetical protein